MKLSELKIGERAVIVKVAGYGGFRRRIVEMGFVKGKLVEAVNNAPLKDPIEYSIMDYKVMLRHSEAEKIEVISEVEAKEIAFSTYNGVITEDIIRQVALDSKKDITVALVGNPNAGKTSLFNNLSGQNERVGNYSGVTVDAKECVFKHKGYNIKIVDLPGTYSLSSYSPEEKYVRAQIVENHPDVIINVVDAANLERNLFLTTQLIDMNLRMVIALTMYDELNEKGDEFNYPVMGHLIGVPIVPIINTKKQGINSLFNTIINIFEGADFIDSEGKLISSADNDEILDKHYHEINLPHTHHKHKSSDNLIENTALRTVRHIHINYGTVIEDAIANIKETLTASDFSFNDMTPRYIALNLLCLDSYIEDYIKQLPNANDIIRLRNKEYANIQKLLIEQPENLITDAKYGFINGALKETYTYNTKPKGKTLTEKIDSIVTNKFLGYPIFLAIMFLIFQATFVLGAYPMQWIELAVAWLADWLGNILPSGMLHDLIVDGIISGVGGVLVFLPNILILYLFISIMEYSGYMARVVFIMDKIMHYVGLHGKSFIPLIMGFGCTVPAIMATRTIENYNSRMITILIAPLVSCSARLPVYIIFTSIFFPHNAGVALFLIYLLGIAIAAMMAILFKKLLFNKKETPFVMELPTYRFPRITTLLKDSWDKAAQYLRKIGTTILVGSILIWALSYFPIYNGTEDNASQIQQEQSYLGQLGKFVEPAMRPLGFDWKASVALITGISAKEVVISTIAILNNIDEEDSLTLSESIRTETKSDGSRAFDKNIAITFMIFVLIYIPCFATIATIKNETNSWYWAMFSVLYTVCLAYGVSFIAYQSLVLNLWQELIVSIILLIAMLSIIFTIKRKFSKKEIACDTCSNRDCNHCSK